MTAALALIVRITVTCWLIGCLVGYLLVKVLEYGISLPKVH